MANTIDPARLSPVGEVPVQHHAAADASADQSAGGQQLDRPDAAAYRNDRLERPHRPPDFSDKDLIYGRCPRAASTRRTSIRTRSCWTTSRRSPIAGGRTRPARDLGSHVLADVTNELILSGTRDYQRRGTGDYETNYTRTSQPAEPVSVAPNWPTINATGLSANGNGEYLFGGDGLFWLITNYATLAGQRDQDHG